MVEQIFFSLQVKRSAIISKRLIYANCFTSCRTKSRQWAGLHAHTRKKRLHSYCIVLSLPPEMKTLSELVSPEKQKLNFPRSALFIMKTRVCLIYFLNDNYLIILYNKNYFIVTNNAIAF